MYSIPEGSSGEERHMSVMVVLQIRKVGSK
jgi:hypothetical protein